MAALLCCSVGTPIAWAEGDEQSLVEFGVQWRQTYWPDVELSHQIEGSDRFAGRAGLTETGVLLEVDPALYRTVDATLRITDEWYVKAFLTSDEETEEIKEWMGRLGYEDWSLHVERGTVAGDVTVTGGGGPFLDSVRSFDGDYLAVAVYTRFESQWGAELGAGYARYNFPTLLNLYDDTPSDGAAYIGHDPDMSIVDPSTTFHTFGIWVSQDVLREAMRKGGRPPLLEIGGDWGAWGAGFSTRLLLGLSRITPSDEAMDQVKRQLDVSVINASEIWGLTYHATFEAATFAHTDAWGLRFGAKAGYQGRIHSTLDFALFDDVAEEGSVATFGELDAATEHDSIGIFQILHGPMVGVQAMW